MMKNILIMTVLLLGAFNVQAGGIVTSKDLKDYKENIKNLNCYFSGDEIGNSCDISDSDAVDIRENMYEIYQKDAYGLNAADKKTLDKEAFALLLKITEPDVVEYKKYLSTVDRMKLGMEFVPGARVTSGMSTPDYEQPKNLITTAAKAESNMSLSVDEYQDMVNNSGKYDAETNLHQQTKTRVKYYEGVNFEQNTNETVEVKFHDDNTKAEDIIKKTSDLGNVSSKKVLTTTMFYVKDPLDGFKMKISSMDMSMDVEIDEGAKERNVPIVASTTGLDISTRQHRGPRPAMLEKNKYYFDKDAPAVNLSRNQVSLQIGVNGADKNYYKAEKAIHDAGVEKAKGNYKKYDALMKESVYYTEEADAFIKNSFVFYQRVSSKGDELSKNLKVEYMRLKNTRKSSQSFKQ